MNIKEFINEMKLIKELRENEQKDFNVKFSINIDEVINRRLMYVAEELGTTRAELVRDLAAMALGEVEKELNLNQYDIDSSYGQHLYENLKSIPTYDSMGNRFMIPKEVFFKAIREQQEKTES